MLKSLWTLQIIRNQQRGAETSYTVKRLAVDQAGPDGGTVHHASPQSWGRLRSVLEQVGAADQSKLAAIKKKLDAGGSVELQNVGLNSLDLRLLGFTDVA
ncbi:MAG TPA: hypothetical protein VJV96_19615 [Candidatus Angelobacter sp.]|jgi:hypothetical protein|nr:hypothetical protein [Candidatus Angelobacter sp.]